MQIDMSMLGLSLQYNTAEDTAFLSVDRRLVLTEAALRELSAAFSAMADHVSAAVFSREYDQEHGKDGS